MIKHIRNRDVAFQEFTRYKCNGGYKLKGAWINIVNVTKPYFMVIDNIFIKDEDMVNWIDY